MLMRLRDLCIKIYHQNICEYMCKESKATTNIAKSMPNVLTISTKHRKDNRLQN